MKASGISWTAQALSLVRRKVIVRTLRNGRVHVVSGQTPQVAGAARRGGAEDVASDSKDAGEGEDQTGDKAGREPSVAAGWRGSREAVLEWDQGRGTADARSLPAGGAGLR